MDILIGKQPPPVHTCRYFQRISNSSSDKNWWKFCDLEDQSQFKGRYVGYLILGMDEVPEKSYPLVN